MGRKRIRSWWVDIAFYVPVKGRDSQGALFSASTWQVLRSDFDSMMLDAARARGVEFIQGKAIDPIVDGRMLFVCATCELIAVLVEPVECSVLIDASGCRHFSRRWD
jgi:flavin-dependent dehydrogenase